MKGEISKGKKQRGIPGGCMTSSATSDSLCVPGRVRVAATWPGSHDASFPCAGGHSTGAFSALRCADAAFEALGAVSVMSCAP